MGLVWLNILIHIRNIIKHLDLHAAICRIPFHGCAHTDPAVACRCQPEIETENEIAVFIPGI